MSTLRSHRVISPPALPVPGAQHQARVQSLRARLEHERDWLKRWQAWLQRAQAIVTKQQALIARLERRLELEKE